MLLNFKDWLVENMWGNTPARGRKPSDGWRGKPGMSAGAMPGGMPASGPKMMKKMKKMSEWIRLDESSLTELFKSSVAAFPNTAKRQHATDTIKITKLNWTPYLGLKTLFVRGLAQNEGKEYNPVIMFKNVIYGEGLELTDNLGKNYRVKPISAKTNDVRVRCQCGDFYWRFTHFDHVDHSLYGRNRKKYEAKYNPGSANPQEMPGLCKHLMKLIKVLYEAKILID